VPTVRHCLDLVVLAVAMMLAACGSHPSATSTPTSTSATSPSAAPSSPAGPRPGPTSGPAGNPNNLVGRWHVHGASLDIAPTTAVLVASSGPCNAPAQGMCAETDQLTASPAGDGKTLTLVVTSITYANGSGASVPNPNPASSTAVGDSMQLVLQAPGLLKRTALHGFPGWQGGNPYWCGPGISQSNAKLCGA